MRTLVVLLSLAMGSFAADPKRPIYVPEDARFFDGRWYKVYIEEVKSWQRARDLAKAKSGRLASAPKEATHKFIAALAQNRTLWLGGGRRADALWYWENNEQLTFTAWAPNQPNGNKGEDGLVISNGKWHDHTGKGGIPIVGYIVEWPGR